MPSSASYTPRHEAPRGGRTSTLDGAPAAAGADGGKRGALRDDMDMDDAPTGGAPTASSS